MGNSRMDYLFIYNRGRLGANKGESKSRIYFFREVMGHFSRYILKDKITKTCT